MTPLQSSFAAAPQGAATGRRWVGVGHSADPDALVAGCSAAAQALLGRCDPKLLVVFCSDAYDLTRLLDGLGRHAAGVALIGCTTAGEITPHGPASASVVVTAFGGPGFHARTAAVAGASSRLRHAGEEAASALLEEDDERPHRVALIVSDALGGDQQEVVRGIYGVLGATVPLVGGCAGDGFKMAATSQLVDGEVRQDTLVTAVLCSDAPLGIGVRHGWRRVGEPVLVTRSERTRVYTLDDRPALDVYLERFDAPEPARSDPAAFARFSMNHPLGLGRKSTEEGERYVAEANFDDRSLGMIAEVPQGGIAWFMEGDVDSVLAATDDACRDALDDLDGAPPLVLLAFDCAARRLVLGDDGLVREVDRLARHAAGCPVAGFYSYGEFARTRGPSGFHNETLVVLGVS